MYHQSYKSQAVIQIEDSLDNIHYTASELPIYVNINVMLGTEANKQLKIVESSQEQGDGDLDLSASSSSQ